MKSPAAQHLVVVPHTHWDREWYRSHEEFRYRLVQLLDGLFELLDRDPGLRRFTLDGQLVPLDDYLEVRPGARERIARLVREQRLVIGPWYVLPDEWLVSGEALIRNLRLGLAKAAEFGGGMRLGYVPDQFGHVGQLPQIFAAFGFDAAVLWRGVGDDVDQTCFGWEAPDGTRLFSIYLPQGYGNASELPLDPGALAQRLELARAGLAPWSRIPTLLMMNGSDHVVPRPGLPRALEEAVGRLDAVSYEIGALPDFVERARAEAQGELPVHRGEFRSGLRAPLLEGCASSRVHLKQADFRNDRLLVRWLEPLAAWLGALGGDPDPGILDLLWRVALENHPHDSICGCSIDRVHAQMETRFERVEDLAGEHLRHVSRELATRVRCPEGPDDLAGVVVWNPNAGGRVQAEGRLQLDVADDRAPTLHLLDASDRPLAAHAEIVEPGRIASRYRLPAPVVAVLARGFPPEFSGEFVRSVVCRRRDGRLVVEFQLGRERRPGFDFVAAQDDVARRLDAEGDAEVEFRARRLPVVRLRFVDRMPGQGLRSYRLLRGRAAGGVAAPRSGAAGGAAWIENEAWRVEAAPDGRIRCVDRRSGRAIEDALRLVSEGDRGDEYNFDPVPGATCVERPERARVRLGARSEAEVGLRIDARYRVPVALAAERDRRLERAVNLAVRLEIRLAAGLDRVDVAVEVDNRACDQRLRLHVRAPFRATRFEVESAFEVAARPIEPSADAFGSGRPAELPIGATPQRSFASLADASQGFTVANRGVPEVEALREPDDTSVLVLTLLRSVGWLSREDLVLRPGHAGPGLETPGAQVPGIQRAELSFRLHDAADPRRVAEAHAFAWPGLAFAGAGATDAPLCDGARLVEVDDPEVVVSALEPRAEGAPIVRLYNASAQPRRVRVRWNGPESRSLEAVDPSGRPIPLPELHPLPGPSVELALRGAQIVSLRAR